MLCGERTELLVLCRGRVLERNVAQCQLPVHQRLHNDGAFEKSPLNLDRHRL